MGYGSGYQQDLNQITPSSYRITLDLSTYYPSSTANTASGGVNPYDWDNSAYTNASAMSSAQALVLAQGNVRWDLIIKALANLSDCRIENVIVTATNQVASTNATPSTVTGAFTAGTLDATQQPTALSFTAVFDRDEFILGEWNNYLKFIGQSANGTYTNEYDTGLTTVGSSTTNTAYTGVGGTAVTTTAVAIKDIITNAIIIGNASSGTYSRSYRVYNPASNGDSQLKVTVTPPNSTASNIYSTVSVTQISGTTLQGNPL